MAVKVELPFILNGDVSFLLIHKKNFNFDFKDYYFVVSLNRQSAQTCKEKLGAFRKGLKKLPLEFGEGRFCQL